MPRHDDRPHDTLHFAAVSDQAIRYRHILSNRERFCVDGVMGGQSFAEIGRQLGVTKHTVNRILLQAADKIPQPPRNNKILRLVIWRAKEIGAVEAYLGLRDAEGNHIDDRNVLEPPSITQTQEPMTEVLAPRRLGPRPTSLEDASSEDA